MKSTIKLTENKYHSFVNNYIGICMACNIEHDSVEPDAEKYKCDMCEENQVFGISELLIMGKIEIIEE